MRQYYTNYLIISFLFLFLTYGISGQTFNEAFQDGKVYLKYKDSEPITFTVHSDNRVDVSSVPFIKELSKDITIVNLTRPFYIGNDQKLNRILLLDFEEFERIEEVIYRLQHENVLEYVEKVPLDKIDILPNDSLYRLYNGPQNWNWHLELIHAEEAWDITTGDPNINVAVVDNAVWVDHPDLAGKIVAQRDVLYFTNNANPPAGGDPVEWSHGTHVSGLIGASTNNGIGIASIGYNVSIIAVKAAYTSTPNNISGGYQGIQWAADNGADVINMSWGSSQFSQTNQTLINTISSMGIVLIGSAGNDGVNAPRYPSSYQNVISVASIDWDDAKSYFSNYNSNVDISAPGGVASPGPDGVLSTTYSSQTLGYYDAYVGTSMSTPVVSGLAGLILSINPDLTPAQVEEIIKSTSDDISVQNPNYIGLLGAGRINAFEAVLNTPYEPTAEFMTPVEIITPGTSVNFNDLSQGVPSDWQWTFDGGIPSASNDTSPQNILYQTPGSYDVTLTVTNDFGTSSVTYFDYIQVVTNPSPYIFIQISDSLPCIVEDVILYDSSMYAPTTWDWNISPVTHAYVNGTSAASQNPVVQFLAQGQYSVTLTASNVNGMTSKIFENVIHVQGIAPPYTLDMEDATPGYFNLWDTIKSQTSIDLRAANNSSWGMHFHGDPIPTGWHGHPVTGTPEEVWGENPGFISEAHLCGVDARGFTNVKLAFDLRQTYSLGPKYSFFRVLINGNPIEDFEGRTDFNPVTAGGDAWQRAQFDLSEFTGSVFDITLQACTRFSDHVQGEGDNVFIDNIEIVNSVSVVTTDNIDAKLQVYPNPSSGRITIELHGFDKNACIEVFNIGGQAVYKGKQNKEAVEITNLSPGVYFIKAYDRQKEIARKLLITQKM